MQIKVRLDSRLTQRWAKHFSKQTLLRAVRVMGPTLVALTLAGVANTARAQGTISFSGAQTFMQTVQTFAIYAGAVICFGGLIFAGIRMMSGRFHEAVLERDYCLAWFLVGLSQSKLRDLLIFKGGTALKRCHFGDYRFSEDLDFTLARRVEFSEIRAGLEEVYELVAQGSGIRFSFESEGRQTHVNSYTFYLRYQGPLPTSNTVKVDITIAEILLFPVEQLPVLRTYPEFEDVPEDRPIPVYSLNEIATEKIVALQDRARNEPRDLYDLWFLTSHAGIDIGHLIGAITERLRFREKDIAGVEDRILAKEARLMALWNGRLGHQMETLPQYDDVFRTVHRELRQAAFSK